MRRGLIIAITLLTLLLVAAIGSLAALGKASYWAKHSDQVRVAVGRFLITVVDAETGVRGYMLSRDRSFLEPYGRALTTWRGELDTLRSLTADNPAQQARVARIDSLARARLGKLVEAMRRDHVNLDAMAESKRLMKDLRAAVAEVEDAEVTLDDERSRIATRNERLAWIFALGSLAALGFLVAYGWYVRRADVRERIHADARAQLAERFRTLVVAMSQVVWTTDADGQAVEQSPTWCDFTGQTWDEAKGSGWLDALHPDDRALAQATWQQAVAQRQVYAREYRVRRHDGVYIWMGVRGAPVVDGAGKVVEWIGINVDITASKEAAAAHERTLRFAEEFVGVLGHDLRNPLGAVRMSAELMRGKLLPGQDGRPLERILASTDRMARMVAQLLDLTRSRLGGGILLERRSVDLREVMIAAVEEALAAHPECDIRVDAPESVMGDWDPDRLAQVASNLVGNAIQHGDSSCPIEVKVAAQGERQAVLEVRNCSGVIPAEQRATLFEPFRRGTRSNQKGLGLGLYITKQIVLAHGGSIEVESTARLGTRFRVRLPAMYSHRVILKGA
jgi:PAS domain S-box-containing protein